MPIEEDNLRLGIDTVSMATVFRRRKELNELLEESSIAKMIGERADLLIESMVGPYCKKLKVPLGVIEQSLFELLGHRSGGFPTIKDCKKANSIIAGNMYDLKLGIPLKSFSGVYKKEWTPIVVVDGYRDVFKSGKAGFMYTLLSMAGYTATEVFKKLIPSKGMFWHIHRGTFNLPANSYSGLTLPEAYVGMWAWVLLEPELSWEIFSRAESSPSFTAHNRSLLRDRAKPCVLGHTIECHQCPIGMETCYRGTHRGMLIHKKCHRCGTNGLFRQDEPEASKCIACANKEFSDRKRYAMKKEREKQNGNEHAVER